MRIPSIPSSIRPTLSAYATMSKPRVDMDMATQQLQMKIEALRKAMQQPQPATPKRGPAMNQGTAAGAGIVGALAALLGARQPFIQQGLQGFTQGMEQNADRVYGNAMLDYQDQEAERRNALDLAKFNVDVAGDDYNRKAQLFGKADARAQSMLDDAIQLGRQKEMDRVTTKNNIAQALVGRVKDSSTARLAVEAMRRTGQLTPEYEAAILQSGLDGDVKASEEARAKWARVPIKNIADARSLILAQKLNPQSAEARAILARGEAAERFVKDYRMTNEQKKAYWQFQQQVLQAGREDLLEDRQAFSAWLQENYIDPRFRESQNRIDKRTRYTQDSITNRSKGTGEKPDALRGTIVAPFDPVLRPLLPHGFEQGKPAPTTKPPTTTVRKPKQVKAPARPSVAPVKGPTKTKKGGTTTFDFGGK